MSIDVIFDKERFIIDSNKSATASDSSVLQDIHKNRITDEIILKIKENDEFKRNGN